MAPEHLPDPLVVALNFASILERLRIRYVIGGSVASSMHGEPRSTHDVDFVVELEATQVGELTQLLQLTYYVDRHTALDAVQSATSFNVIHLETAVKVDVFVAGGDPFDIERIQRREPHQIGLDPSEILYLDTPEYTVLRKLEWYRRGDEVSERQWLDVLGILRAQGSRLDQEIMMTWSERLGVLDLLERAIGQADSGG
jgi:hypothetical protein